MTFPQEKSAGASSGPAPSPRPLPAASPIRAPASWSAIGARNPGKAGLAEDFPGARILDGYEALLADPEVDAIYIATPHPEPCRMGDQGGGSRQACAVREADGRSPPSRPTR